MYCIGLRPGRLPCVGVRGCGGPGLVFGVLRLVPLTRLPPWGARVSYPTLIAATLIHVSVEVNRDYAWSFHGALLCS